MILRLFGILFIVFWALTSLLVMIRYGWVSTWNHSHSEIWSMYLTVWGDLINGKVVTK